jgi:hypothetical protein
MITLASLIDRFGAECVARYGQALLPSHRQALQAMQRCRTHMAPRMLAQCSGCDERLCVPHSCGHRSCPHCQHFESQRWLERQTQRLVAGDYFLVTFTLPAQLRPLAWQHQRIVYDLLMDCAWQTLRTFSQNHRHLRGSPGAISVLHTHARDLHFHPHVHLVIPGAALDSEHRLWRTLPAKAKYLFNGKALAKVFRARFLAALSEHGLLAPDVPMKWVTHCTRVGDGRKALVYLGRYLYRGVIQEHDIVGCNAVNVTYRWRDGKTGRTMTRTVAGAAFLWLLLQHVLPRGFRRSRNHGFLHPNSKRLVALMQLLVFRPPSAAVPSPQRPAFVCRCCGAPMTIVERRLPPQRGAPPPAAPAHGEDRST